MSACHSLWMLLRCFEVWWGVLSYLRADFLRIHSIAWIPVHVLFCWRAPSPLLVQVCWEICFRVNLTLEIDRRCPLSQYCLRRWLNTPSLIAGTRTVVIKLNGFTRSGLKYFWQNMQPNFRRRWKTEHEAISYQQQIWASVWVKWQEVTFQSCPIQHSWLWFAGCQKTRIRF